MFSYIFGIRGKSGFGSGSTSTEVAQALSKQRNDQQPKRIVAVTGCTAGIGEDTVRALIACGQNEVIMICRDEVRMNLVAKDIAAKYPKESNGAIHEFVCELGDLKSVKACAERILAKFPKIDVLLNNAGVSCIPFRTTPEGFEIQFGTNVVGHYVLTKLLLSALRAAGTADEPAKVINVASEAHRQFTGQEAEYLDFGPYSSEAELAEQKKKHSGLIAEFKKYCISKLGNVHHVMVLTEDEAKAGNHIIGVSLHPGVIKTEIMRHVNGGVKTVFMAMAAPFRKSVPQGAATNVFTVMAPKGVLKPGAYYGDCNECAPSAQGKDIVVARKMTTKLESSLTALGY